MTMSPERIAYLRDYWSDGGTPGDHVRECLGEIERLQKIKPAPTEAQVREAMRLRPSVTIHAAVGDLFVAGLLADSPRDPGWYWMRRTESETFLPAQWTADGTWLWVDRVRRDNNPPYEVGARLPDPPSWP